MDTRFFNISELIPGTLADLGHSDVSGQSALELQLFSVFLKETSGSYRARS